MKHILQLFFLSFSFTVLFAQNDQWTWMQGNNVRPQIPVYGKRGVAAPDNKPGGRKYSVSWTDTAGNFWLYGGSGYGAEGSGSNANLSDLWKYTVATGQWTWVAGDNIATQPAVYGARGIPGTGNHPGSREGAVSWTDTSGDLWLFGGYRDIGSTAGVLNDLWRYSISEGQWTWVSGDDTLNRKGVYGVRGLADAANKPGARTNAVSWTDTSGNLWLFGGYGLGEGSLNDLWKYSTATALWTWVHGDSTTSRASAYGKRGTEGPANKPGSRLWSITWTDVSGQLWLFGGYGQAPNATGPLNDLWKFNPSSNRWTWMGGDTIPHTQGFYGIQGKPDSLNKPAARNAGAGWSDAQGNLWLFGGNRTTPESGDAVLNDLWMYVPSLQQWTWIGGDTTVERLGIYGVKGSPAASNKPGARSLPLSMKDKAGNFWLFGGTGYTSVTRGLINDLWKYDPATRQWTWMSGDNNHLGDIGVYGTKGVENAGNTPGGRYGALNWKDEADNLWLFGGNGYTSNAQGNLNDLWRYSIGTKQWTWISGDHSINQGSVFGTPAIPGAANTPAARLNSVNWTDKAGNFWLFGGNGNPPERGVKYLGDLWKFSPSLGMWTCQDPGDSVNPYGRYGTRGVPAAGNRPGARQNAVSWTDKSGNLWLFGGSGYSTVPGIEMNDLWKYSPADGLWTWVSGDNQGGVFGVYGVKGTASPANMPGVRQNAVGWTDQQGNLWLFGGYGRGASGLGHLNDLWKFNPLTGLWTWMSGDNIPGLRGVYGKQGVAAPANVPTSRYSAANWTDASGNLWLYGGYAIASSGNSSMNDLWKYSSSSGLWTWVSGDTLPDQLGVYGTRGSPASGNKPGARYNPASWTDTQGNLWLFGGFGFTSNGPAYMNDLWQYSLSAVALPVRLNSFTAQKEKESAMLYWKTAREQNSFCFIIERSPGGSVYDSIGTVLASGANAPGATYVFADRTPFPGNNFYRLKQVDLDGRFEYSGIASIYIEAGKGTFSLEQNPVYNTARVGVQLPSSAKITLQVRDMSGHLLVSEEKEGKKGTSVYSIPVGRLAKGTYLISLVMDKSTSTKTFTKL